MNPNHPLSKASFFVEQVKYGQVDGNETVVGTAVEMVPPMLRSLLDAASCPDIDAVELAEDVMHYANNWSMTVADAGGPGALVFIDPALMYSIFLDGLMHGVALGARLKGEVPERLRD